MKVADSGAELQAMVDVVEAHVSRWQTQGQSCRLWWMWSRHMCQGGRLRGRAAGYGGCGRDTCVKVADSGAELQAMVDVVEAHV